MMICEINFDGIIGPTHNYAGLSLGNIASSTNAGAISQPRAAALQGVEKMRTNMALGLHQGFLMPLDRPNLGWLSMLDVTNDSAEPHIRAAAWSASSMWAANAATISPAPDSGDGRCHLTVANLQTMAHRSHEWPGTLAQLRCAFSDSRHFAVHGPVSVPYGDEGAANHMRLCDRHDEAGVELFVYGTAGGAFPARQHIEASKAIIRRHGLNPAKTLLIEQSREAIAAGAFHNDVVAVANQRVLFCHQQAFEDKAGTHQRILDIMPSAQIVEVPSDQVSLNDAIKSYLFNAQLVTLPDTSKMALIVPSETTETPAVWNWLQNMLTTKGPIGQVIPVNVRQSMANGGGPACLRLRVVADPQTIDPRFIATEDTLDIIAAVIDQFWPEQIDPGALTDLRLIEQVLKARETLLDQLDLAGLI